MNMPPKLENLLADLAFETRNEARCRGHYCHAQSHRDDRNTDNQPGKILAGIESNTAGDEEWKVQERVW